MKPTILITLILLTGFLAGGCKKKEEPKEPEPYASFTVNGQPIRYDAANAFGKFCILTHYCGDFLENKAQPEKNQIAFGFPSDVASGKSYHTGDHHFMCLYIDGNGKHYHSYSGGSILVDISQWQGNGKWVKGTFSGTLASETNPTTDSVTITNGQFEGLIYFIE